MAIHSAKVLCKLIIKSGILDASHITDPQRSNLEEAYKSEWSKNFSKRLFWGGTIQQLFGNRVITGLSIKSIHAIPPLVRWLVAKTQGNAITA